MVPEADLADARAEVARLREQPERNSRMHEEAELLMFDELERLRAALKPFADIAERMHGYHGESPLWAVLDECKAAHAVLNPPKEERMKAAITKNLGYVPAGHQLKNHKGLCRNWHGHNYEVEVEVEGKIHTNPGAPDEGMVVDFSDVSAVWKKIKPIWDHMNLNVVLTAGLRDINGLEDGPEMDEAAAIAARVMAGYPTLTGPTTAENLAGWLLTCFRIEGVPATAVTLWETPTSNARVEHGK